MNPRKRTGKTPEEMAQLSQEDLAWLDKVPVGSREKNRRFLEDGLRLINLLRGFASEFIPAGLWDILRTKEELLGAFHPQVLTRLALGFLTREPGLEVLDQVRNLIASVPGAVGSGEVRSRLGHWLDEWLDWVRLAFQVSLVDEFGRRYQAQETPAGCRVRDFLNQRDDQSRRRLLEFTAGNFWWHPECGSPAEARKEIASMADEALWERIAELPDFTKRFEERLSAMLDGAYNRIPENAAKSVRGQLETLKQKRGLRCSLDHLRENEEGDTVEEHPILTKDAVDRYQSEERLHVLIDHCMEHPSLSQGDREVLGFLRQGFTQEEIAQMQGRTRSSVSHHKRRLGVSI